MIPPLHKDALFWYKNSSVNQTQCLSLGDVGAGST